MTDFLGNTVPKITELWKFQIHHKVVMITASKKEHHYAKEVIVTLKKNIK